MAMLEAMSYGIPVVVTDVGSIPDVIANGDSGIMVKPGDVAGISDAIILLLRQADLAQRMADTAVRIVRQGFAPEHVGACLSRLYDSLGAGTNEAAGAHVVSGRFHHDRMETGWQPREAASPSPARTRSQKEQTV